MNVPNEQNGANAIIGSVTKKKFTQIYFQVSNFGTIKAIDVVKIIQKSYLGTTFYYFQSFQN